MGFANQVAAERVRCLRERWSWQLQVRQGGYDTSRSEPEEMGNTAHVKRAGFKLQATGDL
eukprot:4112724-Pyramimonas_sp.AAC.1